MKLTHIIGILLLVVVDNVYSQDNNCVTEAQFGEAKICLPEIEGYQECYSDSIVKQIADGTEVAANMVLGFYVSDEIYQKKDSIGLISFDDYFKIYGTKQIKDYEADTVLLTQMEEILNQSFFTKNWETMKKEIDEIGLDVKVATPTVIKSYNMNDQSFSFIMITRYEPQGLEPFTVAATINGYLHNDRLVWMAYYLNYEDEQTMNELEKKSNYILTQLMNITN